MAFFNEASCLSSRRKSLKTNAMASCCANFSESFLDNFFDRFFERFFDRFFDCFVCRLTGLRCLKLMRIRIRFGFRWVASSSRWCGLWMNSPSRWNRPSSTSR
ncbi:Uncharacterized protein APZ42_020308 [Daphnia magna]|uniref:Uncharacterized protein n=1 Tax=Daphnia magna TaxID=35525 RepID=A0A164XKH8_9CRUS|nr:Uncharacterized protein APZ42_020308 [Daphnia magna]